MAKLKGTGSRGAICFSAVPSGWASSTKNVPDTCLASNSSQGKRFSPPAQRQRPIAELPAVNLKFISLQYKGNHWWAGLNNCFFLFLFYETP